MRPTRWRVLVGSAVVAAVLTFAGTRVMESRSASLPNVPLATAVLLALVAVAVLAAAFSLRGRLQGRPGRAPLPPLGAARIAVMAKTASHAGAVLLGVYVGFALSLLPDLDTGLRRERLIAALATAAAAALLVAAGLVLERFCRVPPSDEDRDRAGRGGPSATA